MTLATICTLTSRTRKYAPNVLDIVLSSQKELVDNVKIIEPLDNSDHNQIHFDINVKSESIKKRTGETSTKVTIKI